MQTDFRKNEKADTKQLVNLVGYLCFLPKTYKCIFLPTRNTLLWSWHVQCRDSN